MTTKRFTLNSVLNFDFGICDYGEPIGSLRNICKLLNVLNDENEQLKAHNQYLIELLEHTGAIVEITKGDVE